MVYTLRFFSLKCSLFHNSNLFGSCVIHILYTGCAKIYKNNSGAKRLIKIQLDVAVCSLVHFTAKSLYMFRSPQHPSSGVLKTVLAVSVQFIISIQLLPSNVAMPKLRLEGSSCTDIMTGTGGCGYSFSTPDGGCCGHSKHVERGLFDRASSKGNNVKCQLDPRR